MIQIKLLLALIGAFYFCDVKAAPFRLTKKMHDDLLTQDIANYFNYFKDMTEEELKLSGELANISNFTMRLEAAEKIHPKMYQALRELMQTTQAHMRLIDNEKASNFYANYIKKVMTTEAQSGSINTNYAEFIKDEISEFNKLDKEAQEAFICEFPEIAKILRDTKF